MKRKRNSDNIASWVVLLLTILVAAIIGKFLLLGTWDAGGLAIGLFILAVLICIVVFSIVGTQHEETLEYFIYEYEIWDRKSCKYETYYFIGDKSLRSKFFLHFHIEDYEETDDPERIVKQMLNNTYSNHKGFKTKEEAMQEIISNIFHFISLEKEEEKLTFKNIQLAESFNVADLRRRAKEGEFKQS